MGIFDKIADNVMMARYLKVYNSFLSKLPPTIRIFFNKDHFISAMNEIMTWQKKWEIITIKDYWPFCKINQDTRIKEHFNWATSEGATNEDILWWWNLSPLDKIILRGIDNAFINAEYASCSYQGLSVDEARKRVSMSEPVYGGIINEIDMLEMTSKNKENYLEGNMDVDGVLPIELHKRVDEIFKRAANPNNLTDIHLEKGKFSSYNAWVRYLIKNGRL